MISVFFILVFGFTILIKELTGATQLFLPSLDL